MKSSLTTLQYDIEINYVLHVRNRVLVICISTVTFDFRLMAKSILNIQILLAMNKTVFFP